MADVGKRIREIREAQNLTQDELARRLGTHPQTVWRYEAGTRIPNAPKIEEIARALGAEPGELFERPLEGTPTPPPETLYDLLVRAGGADSELDLDQEGFDALIARIPEHNNLELVDMSKRAMRAHAHVVYLVERYLAFDLPTLTKLNLQRLRSVVDQRRILLDLKVYVELQNRNAQDALAELEMAG